jgi:repressor LexA
MTLPLTKQQERLWRYIRSCERSPSYVEMAQALGLSSKSGVNRLVEALSAKGYVRYTPCRSRSIIAVDPRNDLTKFKSSDLMAELERRGILLGCDA